MNAIANRQVAIAWPFWYLCQSVATVREHKIYKPITQLYQTQCGQTCGMPFKLQRFKPTSMLSSQNEILLQDLRCKETRCVYAVGIGTGFWCGAFT